MRRIAFGVLSTITGLVLVFSYHTSLNQSASGAVTLSAGAPGANRSSGKPSPADTSAASPSDDPAPGPTPATSPTSAPAPTSATKQATPAPTKSPAPKPKPKPKTFTGDPADTQWGVVQVRITVQNGKITSSQAIQQPSGNDRDQEINSWAVPALNQEVVKAQSAQIDAVSGATVTSGGYQQSLQSAIDQAHL